MAKNLPERRILAIDIETAPHLAYAWGLRRQDLTPSHIVRPGRTLCVAAKWVEGKACDYDEAGVQFFAEWQEGGADAMLQQVHGMLDRADLVVHYNGLKFDIPVLNAEFAHRGWSPPAPSTHIDLYRIVRRNFRVASNKLDYICQHLGLGSKVKHKGLELWDAVMRGDTSAQATMARYNKRDVVLLCKLFKRLLPWIDRFPSLSVYGPLHGEQCPRCKSKRLQSRGYAQTKTRRYRRVVCLSCGGWSRLAHHADSEKVPVHERLVCLR